MLPRCSLRKFSAAPTRRRAAVVGAGVNGEAAARTFAARGRAPLVWDVDAARASAVAERVGGRVAVSRDEALAADLLVTVTPGREMLLPEGSLRPGQHVSLMGADGPGKAEIAVAELARVHVFCDDWEQASHGGECAAAVEAGVLLARERDGDRPRADAGDAEGRRDRRRHHRLRLDGLALQDLAVALVALERAATSICSSVAL